MEEVVAEVEGVVDVRGWRMGEARRGLGEREGIILCPLGLPPWWGSPVREDQEGRGKLCPRGLDSLRFDGRPGGIAYAIAEPG